jgi:phosphoribosylamine--glycine ligase
MIVDNEPYVIEFNVRLGDPETQVLLPRLKTDFLALALQGATGEGSIEKLSWSTNKAVTFTIVTGNYPKTDSSAPVTILGLPRLKKLKNILVYHANTTFIDNIVKAKPGRVLNIIGYGKTLRLARLRALRAIKLIAFESMDYRLDIATDLID